MFKKTKVKKACTNSLEAFAHFLTHAVKKTRSWGRWIAHAPEIRGARGQMILVILDALHLVFTLIRH